MIALAFFFGFACLAYAYTEKTDYASRVHDINGHLEHIDYIWDNHKIPEAKTCWECYQPPAYYQLAAGLLSLTHAKPSKTQDAIHAADVARPNAGTLQRLSLVLTLCAAIFAFFAVREVAASTYEHVIASALLMVWPTTFIEGCKLGNDTLFSFFTTASISLLMVWGRRRRPVWLVLSGVMAALAVQAKLNGFVTIAIVVAAVAAHVLRPPEGERRVPKGAWITGGVLLVGVAAIVWTVIRYKHGELTNAGAADELASQKVSNTLGDYFSLELESYEHSPWAAKTDSFWSYFFRTGLFGEWGSEDAVLIETGKFMEKCAAAFIPFAFLGLLGLAFRAWNDERGDARATLLAFFGLLGWAITFRAMYPYQSSNDFRYVVAIVLPLSIMTAKGAQSVRQRLGPKRPHLGSAFGLLLVAFASASWTILLHWK